jgi:hypothetical protein
LSKNFLVTKELILEKAEETMNRKTHEERGINPEQN